MKNWRQWTNEQRRDSRARAAYLFLNMTVCTDCGLDWPEGLVHDGCPGPEKPPPVPDLSLATCEVPADKARCPWVGVVTVVPRGGAAFRACREHAAPYRGAEGFDVIDTGRSNRKVTL